MKKIFLFNLFFALLWVSTASAQSSNVPPFQLVPAYNFQWARFDAPSGSTASFSGSGVGFDASYKVGNRGYSLGLTLGYLSLDMDNSSNTGSQYESLSGSQFNFGVRAYGSNLFLGLGFALTTATNSYVGPSERTTSEFSGTGIRLETGVDIPLGSGFLFVPKIRYDIMNLNNESSVSNTEQDFKNFGICLGLGVHF